MNSMPGGESPYWRSVEELARAPHGGNSASDEFPVGAGEWRGDLVSRRNFLLSASLLLAGVGLTGCRRPTEEILPFAKEQDSVRGLVEYYATAMSSRRSAIPLLVKSNDGRPTKIEGNPNCPGVGSGTDVFAQASVLGLYDPDRAQHFVENGQVRSRKQALDFLSTRKFGDGTALGFLCDQNNSPSRERMIRALKLPRARWFGYEPIDLESPGYAACQVFGKPVWPRYQIDAAKVLLALDCDFLGAEENACVNIGQFAATRRLDNPDDPMSRLYAVESLFTVTGANADHRLRATPALMLAITARFAQELLGAAGSRFGEHLAQLAAPAKPYDAWIVPCARDLATAGDGALILPGHRLPFAAQVLVWAMNESLGVVGKTVHFLENTERPKETLADLVKALQSGAIETLVILNSNPGYSAPPDLNWAQAQARAKTVIRLGAYVDETSWNSDLHAAIHWDLPSAHYLESWGDARTADGILLPIQPLIDPLFGGMTELELLARIGGMEKTPYAVVRETFGEIAGTGEENWNRFLHEGFWPGRAVAAPVQLDWTRAAELVGAAQVPMSPTAEKLDVVFHRDYRVDDGRYANCGWLQELPDPITKLTWDNAMLVSPATARELKLTADPGPENATRQCTVGELQLDGRTIRGPVWIQPGMADHTVALALGYGRERAGRIGNRIGFNAYSVRTSGTPHYAHGAVLRKTDARYPLALTQSHWSMEGRPIIRETVLEKFRNDPAFARQTDRALPSGDTALYPNPLDAAKTGAENQWGMSIDLNACIGCSACVIACQSENNIPIVGKEMVGLSREMHWLRIDRYFTGSAEEPKAVNQPMLCQHCETAPCESVCPVNATVHNDEGLNVMVYNRCVGTRYCSNNCPFKVRRFNFFDYNRRPLDQLYRSPLTGVTDGKWDLKRWAQNRDRGSKPEDEWQLARMMRNPDVTVRMRGVMEKCTFCQQRIEQARIAQRVRAGASIPAPLSERAGTVPQTACQQACPANAIVFGDIADLKSKVAIAKSLSRDYQELESLNLKPRVSYRAKVRNPNPSMPT